MMERLIEGLRGIAARVRNDQRRQIVIALMIPTLILTLCWATNGVDEAWLPYVTLAIGFAMGYAGRIDHELSDERARREQQHNDAPIEMNNRDEE